MAAKRAVQVRVDDEVQAAAPETAANTATSAEPANDAPEMTAQAKVTKHEPFDIFDPIGRRLTMRKPAIIEQFRMAERLREVANNPVYMASATPILWLRAIDGEEVLSPETKSEFEIILNTLDDGYTFDLFTTTDARGRTLTLQRPSVTFQFAMTEALREVAANPTYMMMTTPVTWVRAIDGQQIESPKSKADLEKTIMQLDDDGLNAVVVAVQERVNADGENADAYAAILNAMNTHLAKVAKDKAGAKA